MTPRINRREEGLKELASMIADAYRRRATGEIVGPLRASGDEDKNAINESEIIKRIEPDGSGQGFVYTETVRVENFIRNKVRKGSTKK